MIVDPARWRPFGKGRIAPQGSITDNVLVARLAAYKRNVASGYRSVAPDEVFAAVPPGRHLVSTKLDGECWFLHARDGQVHLLSPSGRAISDVPITDEAARLLNDRSILVAGELYAATNSHRPRVYELMAVLSADAARPDALLFAAFDLLLDGDRDAQAWPFQQRAARLEELVGGGDSIHAADFETIDSPAAAAEAFHRIVSHGGAEGIVIRLENGDIVKIKPEITIDAAVVGYAETQGKVHELLLALVRPDSRFLLIGRVSVGMSEIESRELCRRLSATICPSSFRKATDQGTLYHWVRPEVVVEIKCNDLLTSDSHDRPVRRMLLDYSGDGYAPVGPTSGVSPINAVFLRTREDKFVSAAETGMKQVTDHVHLERREPPKFEPSTPLRREVHAKETKFGTAVRKVVTWRTNKHETDSSYPACVAFFTDYSPDRKEPLKTSLRVASTAEKIDEIADQWLAENIKRGWRLVSRDIVAPAKITHEEPRASGEDATVNPLPPEASIGRSITISFARSASSSFAIARKRLAYLAERGKLSIEKDDQGRETWFSVTIDPSDQVELAHRVANLARLVWGWKSAEFCIAGEPAKPIDFEAWTHRLEEVDRCRCDKARQGSRPCASECALGCDRLLIIPSHQCLDSYQSKQLWWTVGSFDGQRLTINKGGLRSQIADARNEPFRVCPNYNQHAVVQKVETLPDAISVETDGWKIIRRREDSAPAWLWPVGHPLPLVLFDSRREKTIDPASAKTHGQTHGAPQRSVPHVTYADVRGQDEAVEAVRDMVELPLIHADLFAQIGVRDAGGGIILAGPPGTGKTLLAKAVAGESKAHIEIVSGPELLSKWFGESERQLRALFNRARELQPSVILFDELDAIAGTRNGDSFQRTFVAQLLTLLDGLEDRGRVFAIATTNRPADIDPALRRPGRFDRVVYMDLPAESGRASLFGHHAQSLKLSPDLDLAQLASLTPGFSGAQIAFACRRAGVLCVKEAINHGRTKQDIEITMEHFLRAIEEFDPPASPLAPREKRPKPASESRDRGRVLGDPWSGWRPRPEPG